jgi:CheY-like chemotaxis protein
VRKASPVLLVEDDELDILTVDRALRSWPRIELVEMRTAGGPPFARAASPGLILLDIKMPA